MYKSSLTAQHRVNSTVTKRWYCWPIVGNYRASKLIADDIVVRLLELWDKTTQKRAGRTGRRWWWITGRWIVDRIVDRCGCESGWYVDPHWRQ